MKARTLSPILQLLIILILFVSAVCAAAWFSYDIGKSKGMEEILYGEVVQTGLERQAISFKKKNRTIYEEMALLRRQVLVDQVAHEELKKQISTLQSELVDAREELAFYQQVVAPEKLGSDLKIQSFKIVSQKQENQYSYRLILVQTRKRRNMVSGTVDVRFEGQKNGKTLTYALSDIVLEPEKPEKFSFKYFQNLDGIIKLPNGFEPVKIYVKANLKYHKSKKPVIDEVYAWNDLLSTNL